MRKREKGNWVLGLMDKVFFKDEKVMTWWEYEKDDGWTKIWQQICFEAFSLKSYFTNHFKLHFRNLFRIYFEVIFENPNN